MSFADFLLASLKFDPLFLAPLLFSGLYCLFIYSFFKSSQVPLVQVVVQVCELLDASTSWEEEIIF